MATIVVGGVYRVNAGEGYGKLARAVRNELFTVWVCYVDGLGFRWIEAGDLIDRHANND